MSEKWDEKVIELAKSLINCQSYSGHEDKAAEALKAYMKEIQIKFLHSVVVIMVRTKLIQYLEIFQILYLQTY